MKDVMQYKNYFGSVHFSADDELFYGKIEGINDLITFEGESVKQLKSAFEEAVDDYLQLCAQVDKPALKSKNAAPSGTVSSSTKKTPSRLPAC